jgi:4a-hydroxytetrahydrobiopterin dehydratase
MNGLTYTKLSGAEVADHLQFLPGWEVVDGMLTKTFEFKYYAAGITFAAACGHLAERLNHHPDLHVGYGSVRVAVVTHDAGGLTPYDFELARRIEAIA